MKFVVIFLVTSMIASCRGHDSSHENLHVHDKDHLKEHFQGVVELDNLSEQELKFYYFTSHDVEGNGKLDGCELVQSLLHFHVENSSKYGFEQVSFSDSELSLMVDHVLQTDDKNYDGFLDYSEFVAGQISRGF